jgi:phenylalanyl-tRNA synthetase beta chain
MIITRNWLNEFINIENITTDEICVALNSIGLEVDSTSKVSIPDGVKIGYIKECEKHPDADKLNICQVDLGESQVQIVCGAKNVAAGQTVAVATVGAVLGDDFKIKKAKLRGVDSHGMICGSSEIGMPTTNDGIIELDDSLGELTLGKDLNTLDSLNDEIIEIELTANRGDCLSINGVARDLSAYFNLKLKSLDINITYTNTTIGQLLNVTSSRHLHTNLNISAADFTNFKLPALIALRTAFVSAYNNNQVLCAMAYATHCFGVLYEATSHKLEKDDYGLCKLDIKEDENGFESLYSKEKISTLGITTNNVVLDKQSDNIQKVVLASFYIDPDFLAQKVYDTKIKTSDVYYRSSRGSESDINKGTEYLHTILSKCGVLIHKSSKHFITEKQDDILTLHVKKMNAIIGQNIEIKRIIQILESLRFKIKVSQDEVLSLTIPQFRHDIKNIADVTEEIIRIIGIDNIQAKPLEFKEINTINETSHNIIKKNRLRVQAISNGFYESISYVFASKEKLNKYGFETVVNKKDITNPITKELNTFRTTILLNLIEAASNNYKHGYNSVSLFEIGTIFNKNTDESKAITFIHSGYKEIESITNNGKPTMMNLFEFASSLSNIIGNFELEPMEKISNDFIHPYQNANIIVDGRTIGFISKLHPSVASDYNINDTFIAEINFDLIKTDLIQATNISKYQSSKRDLSIIAPKDLEYRQIKKYINALNIHEIKQYNLIDIYTDDKLGDNESLTIKFVLQSDDKTMEEDEINSIMDKILIQLKDKLNIGLRD